QAYCLASCGPAAFAMAEALQAPRRASSMVFGPMKAATGPTLPAMVLQVASAKVSEVAAPEVQASSAQLKTAPPAMNFTGWAMGWASLATTGSAANAGAATRVVSAAQAAARVRRVMRALLRFGEWRRPCSRR